MQNDSITPDKLHPGDTIRVIAPSRSMGIIGEDIKKLAMETFEKQLGLTVEFGANSTEHDTMHSSSVQSRIDDIHAAFSDPNIKAIFTVIGGFNSNQLLNSLDWGLIRKNPKIFCGYSDITVLLNAVYAKTGLVTYYGPHFSTLGQKHLDPYTIKYLKRCLFTSDKFTVTPSETWTDDRWYKDQEARKNIANEGYWVIRDGKASGQSIGGNLATFNLLQGTPYTPPISPGSILFLEDDNTVDLATFDRDLESLLQTDLEHNVKGLIIGRFQNESQITRKDLTAMLHSKPQLATIPIVANVDFGHTDPMAMFPVGGTISFQATDDNISITIEEH